MNYQTGEEIEKGLMDLTHWTGSESRLWSKALGEFSRRSGWRDFVFERPLRFGVLAAVAACLALAVVVPAFLPSLSGARERPSARRALELQKQAIATGSEMFRSAAGRPREAAAPSSVRTPDATATVESFARHVVRKSQIDLRAPDVRAVFSKVSFLVREADGEFVEESSMTGVGTDAQATLKLRVRADRISDVMNSLRGLGEVIGERSEGEDVTAQTIDLNARLRNEERVETELLHLLDSRQNAPLKDVLDLREKIGEVRREIERLTAQRDQISRLVALATVLVNIRSDQPEATPKPLSMTKYFFQNLRQAWDGGLTALADSIAWLVSVLVGGLVWWVGLLALALVARHAYRRHRSADE